MSALAILTKCPLANCPLAKCLDTACGWGCAWGVSVCAEEGNDKRNGRHVRLHARVVYSINVDGNSCDLME